MSIYASGAGYYILVKNLCKDRLSTNKSFLPDICFGVLPEFSLQLKGQATQDVFFEKHSVKDDM